MNLTQTRDVTSNFLLLEEIEAERKRMVYLGNALGLCHPAVLSASIRLDQLLLRYYRKTYNR